jgi:hypothetical protein
MDVSKREPGIIEVQTSVTGKIPTGVIVQFPAGYVNRRERRHPKLPTKP